MIGAEVYVLRTLPPDPFAPVYAAREDVVSHNATGGGGGASL